VVRVEKEIRIHRGRKVVEARALFDTGSRGSYFSDKLAREIGYEPYEVAREVGLAVEGRTAKAIGRTAVFLEVDGYILHARVLQWAVKALNILFDA